VSSAAAEKEESCYEDEAASASLATSASASATEESDYSSSDAVPNKRRTGRGKSDKKSTAGTSPPTTTKSTASTEDKGKELWRTGVKTGLGPGKAVFIEKPKPRGDGGVKYVPGRIHPNTMAFLGDLKRNNEREWLKGEFWVFFYFEGDGKGRDGGLALAK
jgi:hypothetical protein